MFLIGLEQSVPILFGLSILGLSCAIIVIPVLPEMLESVTSDKKIAATYDKSVIENVNSGVYVFFEAVGEAIGPSFSAFLTDNWGFHKSHTIYCAIIVIFILNYFLVCGNFKMFTQEPS